MSINLPSIKILTILAVHPFKTLCSVRLIWLMKKRENIAYYYLTGQSYMHKQTHSLQQKDNNNRICNSI